MQNSVALFTGHSEHKFYKLFYWLSALIDANTIVSMIYRAYRCTPLRFQAFFSGYFLGTPSLILTHRRIHMWLGIKGIFDEDLFKYNTVCFRLKVTLQKLDKLHKH